MDHPWQDDRRRFAAMDAQNRLNEEMAESDRAEAKKGSGFGYLVFMAAVIFFKPFADYCIDLYNTLAGYAQSIGGMFGF